MLEHLSLRFAARGLRSPSCPSRRRRRHHLFVRPSRRLYRRLSRRRRPPSVRPSRRVPSSSLSVRPSRRSYRRRRPSSVRPSSVRPSRRVPVVVLCASVPPSSSSSFLCPSVPVHAVVVVCPLSVLTVVRLIITYMTSRSIGFYNCPPISEDEFTRPPAVDVSDSISDLLNRHTPSTFF